MRMLKSKLLELKEREQKEKIEDLKGVQKDIAWGSQIRSYVFCPYTMVKDHRTNYEVGNVEAVMNGDLNGFMESYLKWSKNNRRLFVLKALISVSDKTGIVEFAKELEELGIEIISTGGTYKKLKEEGVKAIEISDLTGFPECLDGRVKTLHPKVHAGILAMRSNPKHMEQLKQLNVDTIDFVVVNLYPFKQTILKEGVTRQEAVENIDIGGPTMLRSAAKNYQDVTVITDPKDYEKVLTELKEMVEFL